MEEKKSSLILSTNLQNIRLLWNVNILNRRDLPFFWISYVIQPIAFKDKTRLLKMRFLVAGCEFILYCTTQFIKLDMESKFFKWKFYESNEFNAFEDPFFSSKNMPLSIVCVLYYYFQTKCYFFLYFSFCITFRITCSLVYKIILLISFVHQKS